MINFVENAERRAKDLFALHQNKKANGGNREVTLMIIEWKQNTTSPHQKYQ